MYNRPIRPRIVKSLGFERPPRDKYLTPRLNEDEDTRVEAIGFLHEFDRDED